MCAKEDSMKYTIPDEYNLQITMTIYWYKLCVLKTCFSEAKELNSYMYVYTTAKTLLKEEILWNFTLGWNLARIKY